MSAAVRRKASSRMNGAQGVLVAAALVALAGCSLAPKYERPPAPVGSAFPHPGAEAGQPAADIDWRSFFADDRLRALIGTALRSNRDLRVAVLNIQQARAQYDIRNADRYPAIGATVGGSRTPTASGGIASTYTAGLAVSAWEIDLFGRIASLGEAALAQYLATEEGRKAVQVSLVANVANAWLNLLADDEQLALTRQTLQTREESLRLTRMRFDAGASSELDWRLAQSLTETARVALAQQQRQRALDLNALTLLVGEPLPATLITEPGIAAIRLPDLPSGTPSDVLLRRPDVRQAEQQLVAATANIGAARAAFFPTISLTATIGTASNELSGLFAGGSGFWSFVPQITVPIFNAGRNKANLEVAELQKDINIAQYEKAIQAAFREVADALALKATVDEQLAAQKSLVDATDVSYRLAEARFNSGIDSFLTVLDSQRAMYASQQNLISLRLTLLNNQVTLYRALGGGWKE
jgi:NodT family efflux transporter outer membrane factor (OMF) lipoprotein